MSKRAYEVGLGGKIIGRFDDSPAVEETAIGRTIRRIAKGQQQLSSLDVPVLEDAAAQLDRCAALRAKDLRTFAGFLINVVPVLQSVPPGDFESALQRYLEVFPVMSVE